ncbi:hypothetical protein BFN03_05760 [Rhodococcus sp. WMMA185]|uniref:hypothetical protein n=1 Tax=Rhodococcus sp. WMMA185 TaxID=679318 RepID=UPI00087825B2|nr:hypothetical protein [Rhodococcus sp. WMMA185]AOW94483.1 hypothetical protein BFN03_05760 [Rhodococcus sp. WMMA185]
MNEAALGVHASNSEPAADRPDPPELIDDDSGGSLDAVSLTALLEVARLTPPQAAQLVSDLAGQLELAGGAGGCRTAPLDDTVMVSDGGRLTIDRVGIDSSCAEINDTITVLLRRIATNCRGPEFGNLVIESVPDATDLEDLVRRVGLVIAPELDPAEEPRRRSQIGELVRAAMDRPIPDGRAMEDRTNVPAGSLTPSTGWYPPVRSAWHTRRRRPSWRQGTLTVLTLVVVVGAVVSGPRVWTELNKGWNTVVNPVDFSEENTLRPVSPPPVVPPDPSISATNTDGVEPAPVQTGAPASAGQITGVTASFADGSCSAGQPCAIRVDVRLDPAATTDTVAWKLNVYDRCTGEVQAGGDITVRTEPGRDDVYGLSKTFLPPGYALAVAAVTSAPAVAASEPLYVPAEKVTC